MLKSRCIFKFWLDEWSYHDSTGIDQRIMRKTIRVESDGIEFNTTWLYTNMLFNLFQPMFFKSDRITDRFACRLNWKQFLGITKTESLTTDGTDWNTPIVWISLCQLRNIVSILSTFILLAIIVQVLNLTLKILEIRHDKVFLKHFFHDTLMLLNYLYEHLLGHLLWHLFHSFEDIGNSWISWKNSHFRKSVFKLTSIN